ncbi:MAG TPA: site-specific integrase [Pyrinomonadaceae bacterium]|nr:site-specific integrase [Pyrinomonadaceae bacterium]
MAERKRRARGQTIPLDGDRRSCRSWGVRVPLKERGMNGRHATHYETFYGTEIQAEKRKEKLLAQVEAGLLFRPAPLTVDSLLDEWLEQKRREGKRHATIYAYTDTAKIYVRPFVGRLRLKELTPVAVRGMLNALQDRKLSTTTIRYARTVLRLACADGVTWGYLKENPAAGVKAPKGAEGRVAYAMNPEEARALVEAALLDPDDLVFAFAVLTGLRPEEYLGIGREHLSLVSENETERGLACVRRVAFRLRGGGWEFPPPKTKKGVRDVPFPAWLYREIGRYGALVDSRRLAMGPEWKDCGLVFPSRQGTPLDGRELGASRFKRLLRRAGLQTHFTLYSLRYTFATLQYLAGERDRVISDLMGHTRTDFTKEVYTKVLPVMREHASDSLERLLFGGVRTALAQSAGERVM